MKALYVYLPQMMLCFFGASRTTFNTWFYESHENVTTGFRLYVLLSGKFESAFVMPKLIFYLASTHFYQWHDNGIFRDSVN